LKTSPFKVFNDWLFDGSKMTPIPKATEKIDILKYNSPITHTFALQYFIHIKRKTNYMIF